METTFISIHDVSPEARILYSSDSVVDILGYTPDELVNHSAWDFFPVEEVPYAQTFHQQRVDTDKAAVLAYCRVKSKSGDFIGCEVCFSVVYDVLIVCTSVYRKDALSEKRAHAAPIVRRMFSSSPRDPRYHMLSHLSAKFSQPVKDRMHEPRAALFLNRFTRTLSIMYATSAIEEVIGMSADSMRGRSFYCCIAENCLPDAVKCLENAKGNDSIAYLRFWFRDPRTDDRPPSTDESSDDEMTTDASDTDGGTDGGVDIQGESSNSAQGRSPLKHEDSMQLDEEPESRGSSGESMTPADTHEGIFGPASLRPDSSRSSMTQSAPQSTASPRPSEPVELEAVISCTSDGLVVCLRKARPVIPRVDQVTPPPTQRVGTFAAPWALEPVLPPPAYESPQRDFSPARPVTHDFMAAIRDQAVFAWALGGINGNLGRFGHGERAPSSCPAEGFPVWTKDPQNAGGLAGAGKGDGIFGAQDKAADANAMRNPGGDPATA